MWDFIRLDSSSSNASCKMKFLSINAPLATLFLVGSVSAAVIPIPVVHTFDSCPGSFPSSPPSNISLTLLNDTGFILAPSSANLFRLSSNNQNSAALCVASCDANPLCNQAVFNSGSCVTFSSVQKNVVRGSTASATVFRQSVLSFVLSFFLSPPPLASSFVCCSVLTSHCRARTNTRTLGLPASCIVRPVHRKLNFESDLILISYFFAL